MKGLFEIHLITKPEYQTPLFGFITNLKNKKLVRPRPTCAHALYGDHPVQPMLTFWLNGSIDEVTKEVISIKSDMITSGIPIIRTKIEAMPSNEGVPNNCEGNGYFEYHFKVHIDGTTDWNTIAKLIVPYGGHLFYNPYNKTLTPIVTIRRYTSLEDLDKVYVTVKKLLENHGYELTAPEKEYSVWDSDVNLDKNWLFDSEPTNFITELNPKMLFV
jgi:hypothetical protein